MMIGLNGCRRGWRMGSLEWSRATFAGVLLLLAGSGMGVLGTPAPLLAQAPDRDRPSQVSVRMVLPSGLHLRSAPELLAPSIAVIPRGQLVCVLETERSWHRVRVTVEGATREGYMAQGFLGDPPDPTPRQVERALCG